jgi:pseudouridine-5'-phosphate glycosidase
MRVTGTALTIPSDEVAAAIAARRPMVALETTLVTHGLPQPAGVETAMLLEAEVRRSGATPVTIGILDGAIRLGMTRAELERLATAPGVSKVNPGNLAAVLASRQPGSTTVAATMFAAHASGIRVFATGGIGGVHRGEAGDVSADLTALSRLPLAVVSSGAKAVLDLPRTVEMLETLGVPVLALGTDEFPAFYRRSSGLPVDGRFESVAGLAEAAWTHFALGSTTAVLVANPIPETDELPREIYESALEGALAGAEAQGLRGRAVTPFLLDRLHALTGGASVKANVALLRHNARVAGELAVALHAIGARS